MFGGNLWNQLIRPFFLRIVPVNSVNNFLKYTAACLTEISMITVGKQHLMDYMPLDVSMVVH